MDGGGGTERRGTDGREGGGGVRSLEGMARHLEMKREPETYQRAGSVKRCIIIGCCENQTRLHFSQPSSLQVPVLFIYTPEEGNGGEERERGGRREEWGRRGGEWVSGLEFVFAHLSVRT